MNKKRIYSFSLSLSLILWIGGTMIGFSQQKTVSRDVTEENGLPHPGATVIKQGTNNGTTTDFDGNFNISVQDGSTLLFPMLDFWNKKLRLPMPTHLIFPWKWDQMNWKRLF